MTISKTRTGIILSLLVLFIFFLHSEGGVTPTPIKQPLTNFPVSLGNWQVHSSRESSQEVVKLLGVDDYIEYNYTNSKEQWLNFYVGFYESVGIRGGYHSPKNCIPGGGWGIDTVKAVEIIPKGKNTSVKISEMIIRNGNKYQVVYYWYQNRGRIIHSEYAEKIYMVLDAIFKKRRDGAFVRLMVPVAEGKIDQAETVLNGFASLALSELEDYLPGRAI